MSKKSSFEQKFCQYFLSTWQDSNLRCILSDLQSDAFDHSTTRAYFKELMGLA